METCIIYDIDFWQKREKVKMCAKEKNNKREKQKGSSKDISVMRTESISVDSDVKQSSAGEKNSGGVLKGVALGATLVLVLRAILSGSLNSLGEDIYSGLKNRWELPAQIEDINDGISDINDKVDELDKTYNNKFLAYDEKFQSYDDSLLSLFTLLSVNAALKVELSSGLQIESEIVDNVCYLAEPKWTSEDTIARDLVSNKVYKAEELTNIPLVIPYMSENQEIYFYGQYNSNYHWHNNCIINVYEDNQLVFVMDALYDDGVLVEYKQAMMDVNKKAQEVWAISKRVNEGTYNSGESTVYLREKTFEKKFSKEDVKAEYIYNIDEFVASIASEKIGYYCGNTSDGQYNDNTGNAYYIGYSQDGTFDVIYQGRFVNGDFHDDTYNAWYIVRSDEGIYMYYSGMFIEGETKKDDNSLFEFDLSEDRIRDLLENKGFLYESGKVLKEGIDENL